MNLQLVNVDSQKNTVLQSMCMAGDSLSNMHTCIDMYREDISEIQGMGLR